MNTKIIAGADGGGGQTTTKVATEAPDSLESIAYIKFLDLLGEGQIGGLVNGAKSIYFDNTPIQNTDGTWNFTIQSDPATNGVTTLSTVSFAYEFLDGQQSQALSSGYQTTQTLINVGVQVKKSGMPANVTITDPNVSSVLLVVGIPSLLSQDAAGNVNGTSVGFNFKISVNNETFSDLSGPLSVGGKTRSRYQASYQYDLPTHSPAGHLATQWTISMRRDSADSMTSAIVNDTWFDSATEIVNSKLTYANSAVIGMTINAQQFSSPPARSYLVDGLFIKVPSNYNATTRKYTGVWDGTVNNIAVSSNPAWILYDLLTNTRYGLGSYISAGQIDIPTLYAIGQYCDGVTSDGSGNMIFTGVDDGYGQGGIEPRFAINTAIQTQADAYKVISDITSVFRGMGFWDGNEISFTCDKPTDPSMLYTASNVIDGMFTYTGTARKDKHSVVMVTWNDPNQYYKQVVEYVEDAKLIQQLGFRKLDTVAFGCTSRGQAHRVGKWILYTESYESNFISFSVSLDSALVIPGETIKIQDPSRSGKRLGGRLKSCAATSATLDAPTDIYNDYSTISIRLLDGTFADRPITAISSDLLTVSWTSPLSSQPAPNAIWIITQGSLVPALARVIGVEQDQGKVGVYKITAIEHNPSKYAAIEQGILLTAPPITLLKPASVDAPTNFIVTESQYLVAPGLIGLDMVMSWSGTAATYDVTWTRDGIYQTGPVRLTTSTPSFEIQNVRAGAYNFTVIGTNSFGAKSSALFFQYEPVGKMAYPGDVANAQATLRTNDILITWDPVTDIGAVTYEVRQGLSWDTGTVLSTKLSGTSITDYQAQPGQYTYYVRSINANGDYSVDTAIAPLALNAPQDVAQFNCVPSAGQIQFRWAANPEQNIVGYEIREGTSWLISTIVSQVSATAFSIPAGFPGTRTFWIKAIASPNIYSVDADFATTALAVSDNVNILWTTNQSALNWPNFRKNLTVTGSSVIMSSNSQRSEYIFPVDLPVSFTARNTISGSYVSLVAGAMTWATANVAWGSPAAGVQWVYSGKFMSVSVRYQICQKSTVLDAGDYDGWRLNGSLTSFNGITPSTSIGASAYATGRYDSNALVVGNATTVDWPVSIPSSFNVMFWILPNSVADAFYWGVTGTGISLRLKYRTLDQSFCLTDSLGRDLVLPYALTAGVDVCIGIAQNATTRKLMVRDINSTSSEYVDAPMTPLGAFTKLCLY